MSHVPADESREQALVELKALYVDVERQAEQVAGHHAGRLQCRRGCCACCVDDLTVFEIEAANIRLASPELLEEGQPREPGACAFLDAEGACRIYADRPYVCRTQGLPLRWIDETHDGELVELRDICPLNEEGEPIEELPEDECWTIGPVEERLSRLQHRFGAGRMTRVPLRSLFRNSPAGKSVE